MDIVVLPNTQENWKYKDSLAHMVSSRPAGLHGETLSQMKKKEKKENPKQ
jgi:hypothetical protein